MVYRISNTLGDTACPVCKEMDGRTFDSEQEATDFLDENKRMRCSCDTYGYCQCEVTNEADIS